MVAQHCRRRRRRAKIMQKGDDLEQTGNHCHMEGMQEKHHGTGTA